MNFQSIQFRIERLSSNSIVAWIARHQELSGFLILLFFMLIVAIAVAVAHQLYAEAGQKNPDEGQQSEWRPE